ncbi:hypothetical protein FOZ63_034011 [Perkinsus olseni]|uniref:Uncharacterized protein n=1 Tax=Perkinsus olseni TaxID=32597 RepID=A0A7J6T0K6_PEROL|nr:hypothetical protein FOZ63_034011 [Perkinsus olseni]
MPFILSLLISALLFVAEAAEPLGKYFALFETDSGGILIYINEDGTVNVIYRCLADRTFRAGPYSLRPGAGAHEYIIDEDSSPGSNLLDLMRERCPELVILDGDLLNLSFASDEKSLISSLGNERLSFQRVDNSFLIPYRSTYYGSEIEVYVSEFEEVEMTVKCGDSEVTAILLFVPDERSVFLSQYVLQPEEIEFHDQFRDELLTVCDIELWPNDFMTMAYVTSTTAYTEVEGERLTLSSV